MAVQSLYPSTIGYEPVSTYAAVTQLALTAAGNQAAFGFVGDGGTISSITFFMFVLSGGTSSVNVYTQGTAAPYGPNTASGLVATSSTITGVTGGFVAYGFGAGFATTPGTQYFAVISDSAASAGSTVQYVSEGLPLVSAGSNRYGGFCLHTSTNAGSTWTSQGQGVAGWYYTNGNGDVGSPISATPLYTGTQVTGSTEFGTMVVLPPGPTLRVAGLLMAPVPHSSASLNAKYNLRLGTPPGNPIQTASIGSAQASYAGAAAYVPAYFASPVLVPGGSTITVTLSDLSDSTFWYASQLIHQFSGPQTMWPFAFGGVAPQFWTLAVTSSSNAVASQVQNQILPFSLILDTITGPYVAGGYQPLGMSGGFQ